MIKRRREQTTPETEQRWFRVKGVFITDPIPRKKKTQDFQVEVPVTGSHHDLMLRACRAIEEEHKFYVETLVAHSMQQSCL